MIKLQKNIFQGEGQVSQLFGNKLIINNVDVYAQYGLKGHNGVDYAIVNGTPLYSCINGTVIERLTDTYGYGKYLKIENDYCGVIYAHMQSWDVEVGAKVLAGQQLGLSNNTGNSTGPHLHFGLYPLPNRDKTNGYNGYIDPLNKSLVQWVDSLEESDLLKELSNEIVKLKSELGKKQDRIIELESILSTQNPISKYTNSQLITIIFNRILGKEVI
jgi:murein DD-endopeptidase MepM/ murein hydrolase activator NlpD